MVSLLLEFEVDVLAGRQAQLNRKEDQDHLLQVHHRLHNWHGDGRLQQIGSTLNIIVLEIAVCEEHHVYVEQEVL